MLLFYFILILFYFLFLISTDYQKNDDFIAIANENDNSSVFDGNYHGFHEVLNTFTVPIIARIFRLYPVTWHNFVSLRWELVGCGKYTDIPAQNAC